MSREHSARQSPEERFSKIILSPSFFRDVWEQKPVVFESATTQLKQCFSDNWIVADDVVAMIEHSRDNIHLFKQGVPLPSTNIYHAYLDGASIIVNKADRCSKNLFTFCQYLAEHFFHHTFAVGYLTPQNSFAVRAHSDDQDVFLIQIWGSKNWKVYNPVVALPYTEEMVGKTCSITQDIGSPCLEYVLNCGDILYIPRGFVHAATTSEYCSFHVTITIPTSDFCWGITIERFIRNTVLEHRLSDDIVKFFRKSILMEGAEQGVEALQKEKHVNTAIETIVKILNSRVLKEELQKHIKSKNFHQKEEYDWMQRLRMEKPNGLTSDGIVGLRKGISCFCSKKEDMVLFKRGDESLEMKIAPSSSQLMRQLAQGIHVKVKDLECEDPFERLCVCFVLLSKDVIFFSHHSCCGIDFAKTSVGIAHM